VIDVFTRFETLRARAEAPALRGALRLPDRALRVLSGRRVVSDGQTLDPEMQMVLRMRRLLKEPPVEQLPLPAGRMAMRRQCRLAGGTQPIGSVRDLSAAGLPARLYTPTDPSTDAAARGPLLLFLHGGGFVYGDLDTHDAVCRFLAERSQVRVLAVDYRRAPEHPFPGPVDDAMAAYTWAREHAADLGVDAERIAVGGDSAGANLATVLCLRAREEGVPQPRLQLLLYPVTDFSQELASRFEYAEGFWLTKTFIDRCRAAYLPRDVDAADPVLSPLQAKDLDGLAPASVTTAGFDPLRDEGEAYARRLSDDGVEVQMTRQPGLLHGFANMVGASSAARAAMHEVVAQLRTRL